MTCGPKTSRVVSEALQHRSAAKTLSGCRDQRQSLLRSTEEVHAVEKGVQASSCVVVPVHAVRPRERRYGSEAGKQPLREAIASTFYSDTSVTAGEVFVSDGSKCDLGRLQMTFGSDLSVAVQVPWALPPLDS